ncbi:MAG: DUF1614 domain-containing protein [Gemmatimonadota bacterium]
MPRGCFALAGFVLLLALLPFVLANAVLAALARLGLGPGVSLLIAIGIFLGGTVNIPIRRIPREETIAVPAFSLFGIPRLLPRVVRRRSYTVIAVNLGGCVIPTGVAAYQLYRLAGIGAQPLGAALVAVAANVGVCYLVARPVPRVGIMMPALVPALVAVVGALLLAPDLAPAIAFTAGVLGPLIGADILHLRDPRWLETGMASIGGAGTFDGIVLSGLVATLLA